MASRYFRYNSDTKNVDEIEIEVQENVAPYVHQDSMDPLFNHCDGKLYDSRQQFRSATKKSGCVEIGNDRNIVQKKQSSPRNAILRAYEKVQNGYKPEPKTVDPKIVESTRKFYESELQKRLQRD